MFSLRKKKPKYEYFGLIDSDTGRLLTLDIDVGKISILRDWTKGASAVTVPTRSFFEGIGYNLLRPGIFHFMKWNIQSLSLEVSVSGSKLFREKSLLISAKGKTFDYVIEKISGLRTRVRKSISLQETIYAQKAFEAQRFRDRGYPEEEVLEYPFILQYADYAKISPRQATDSILLKSSMSYEMLAKTETLRIKYMNAIRDAQTMQDLAKIRRDFLLDYDIKI